MKIALFAGTSEGKALAACLAQEGHEVLVTVATDYGREVFFDSLYEDQGLDQKIQILEGRLNEEGMRRLVGQVALVFDATHPYATEVSKNIISACESEGKDYIRVLREDEDLTQGYEVLRVKDQEEAIGLMDQLGGKVLLTTGSKDLKTYAAVEDYANRLYPRILPDLTSLGLAEKAGYKKSHTICMQGPFTAEMNAALLRMIGASYLLTKDTGRSGGFLEKLEGCRLAGARAIVLDRPKEEVDLRRSSKIQMTSLTLGEIEGFFASRGLGQGLDFAWKDLEAYKEAERERTAEAYLRFPLFIDLRDQLVVLVGGGRIGRRRLQTLLGYGPRVRLIDPRPLEKLLEGSAIEVGQLEHIQRDYQKGDLAGAILALAATNQREVNQAVGLEAKELGIFASIADCKEESSFYFPATWKDQGLSLGMVGSGKDHSAFKQRVDQIKEILNKIDIEDKDEKN